MPPAVVTVIFPAVASGGTVAVMIVPAAFIVNVADVPLNPTKLAPLKLVPLIVTGFPIPTAKGVNEVMVGGPGKNTVILLVA